MATLLDDESWRDRAVALLGSDDDEFVDSGADPCAAAAWRAYVEMSESFFAGLAPVVRDGLGMAPCNADCRGEVLLVLLGLKPCVLFAYGTRPDFADDIERGLVAPWAAAAAPRLRRARVARDCAPCAGVNFVGGLVLYDAASPRSRHVSHAFFPRAAAPPPGDAPLLMGLVGRALGYPARPGARRNCHVAFTREGDAPAAGFRRRAADSELVEFLVEGPGEVPAAARYFERCRAACAPHVRLELSLCGVVVPLGYARRLAAGGDVAVVARLVAATNRGEAPVTERE